MVKKGDREGQKERRETKKGRSWPGTLGERGAWGWEKTEREGGRKRPEREAKEKEREAKQSFYSKPCLLAITR